VAVIRLKTPTSYPAVTLASTAPRPDTSITSIGWGITQSSNKNPYLYYASLEVGAWGTSPCPSLTGFSYPRDVICERGIRTSGGYTSACSGDSGSPAILSGTTTQVGIVAFGPSECGTDRWGASTSVALYKAFIDERINSPSVCTLNRGEIVQVTIKAPACTTKATKAAANAAAQLSEARDYCIVASKCRRIGGGRSRIYAKIAINSNRYKAKRKITKAFESGAYSTILQELLPRTISSKYVFQRGRACIYPSTSCTFSVSTSPSPAPNPPSTVCALNRGEIIQATIKAPACTTKTTKAAALAAAQLSEARDYCIVASKCKRIPGGRNRIKAKIAINSNRYKAKRKITKAFESGAYSTKLKSLLPASLSSKYVFQRGRACIYPSTSCAY